ncbi:hypothetical protein GCM10028806_04110 [Spirosoma terrae]|uniref:Uncharacterized protein n=1 Tax=Spirosoma terrae TaxID=1968276 RepID=A0A6L9LI52_9BACT|nr:hypothetical protein [Spirosoma terrae]NDU98348.1 hypothetical protein [Spirosoma terrae]
MNINVNKKLTTVVGLAVGASLLAGYGIYKYFANKRSKAKHANGKAPIANGLADGYIGNGLVKSNSLYRGGVDLEDTLIGGGLYKTFGHDALSISRQ